MLLHYSFTSCDSSFWKKRRNSLFKCFNQNLCTFRTEPPAMFFIQSILELIKVGHTLLFMQGRIFLDESVLKYT